MGIGVDEPVAEDHGQPDLGAAAREGRPVERRGSVVAAGVEHVGQRAPVQELEGQHLRRGALGERAREVHVGLVVEGLGEALRVGGLPAQVQLGQRAAAEARGQVARAVRARAADVVLDRTRQRGDDVEVLVDHALDPVVADLDRHLRAVGQRGSVDLGDRRHADRVVVERREELVDGRPQLALDDPAHLLGRLRVGVLLQLHERGLQVVGERAADAQQLAQLDVDRPELLQREAHPLGLGVLADEVGVGLGEMALHPRGRVAAQAIAQPVAAEDPDGVREAGGVRAQ